MTWPPRVLHGATKVGLGLAALGRPAYITAGRDTQLGGERSQAEMRRRTETVLDAAYGAGVRYFDVARSYGLAESFLSGWLARRQLGPAQVAVGSKWGYTYVGDWRLHAERHEVQDLSVDAFERQFRESRGLLGSNLVLYQVHSATLQNGVLSSPPVLDALRRVRDGGLAIGLTVTGPNQGSTVDAAVELGMFDTVQATWNLLEPSCAPALVRAHEAGLTVIVKEALANGRLTAAGDQPAFVDIANRHGVTPDALAISAALAQPWAGIVLSGAVSVASLSSNLEADPSLWTPAVAEPAASLVEPAAEYWAERSRREWA